MKAFIHMPESFISQWVKKALEVAGFDVVTFNHNEHKEGQVSLKTLQRISQVIIYELPGHEAEAIEAVRMLGNYKRGPKGQVFIGISTPMVWAGTPWSADSPQPAETVPGLPPKATLQRLSAKDMALRRPAPGYARTFEAEQAVLACHREGRFATYVVCPGIPYGCGESDEHLHTLFRTAWECKEPCTIYGSGSNVLPMIHVRDLAEYVVQTAMNLPAVPTGRYLIAVDNAASTQRQVVESVAAGLGNGATADVPRDACLLMPEVGLHLLNVALQRSALPLPDDTPLRLRCAGGLVENLAAVKAEYLHYRRVTPLRIVLAGPPCSGKTRLATRLAKLYNLPHIRAQDILDRLAAGGLPDDLAAAAAAEMSSKEPRLQHSTLARILHTFLPDLPYRNTGYILDGFPKNMVTAKAMFQKLVPKSEEEKAADQEELEAYMAANKGKVPDKVPGAPPDGFKFEPDFTHLPHYLLITEAPDDALKARLTVMGERDAKIAAELAAAEQAKGQKPGPPPKTHNNPADFARRYDAYKEWAKGDAADLKERVAAAKAAHVTAMEKYEEDLTAYMRAKRYARQPGRVTFGGPADSKANSGPGSASSSKPSSAQSHRPDVGSVAVAAMNAPRHQLSQAPLLMEPPKPELVLPEFGGFPGMLQDQGTTVMRVKNPDAKLDDGKPNFEHDAPLPEAEAAAVALIGPPHNYLGFPDPADARSASPERSGTAGAQASALTVGTAAAGPSGELSTASVGGGAAAGGAPGSPGPRDLTQPASLTLQSRLDYEPAQRDAAVKEQRDANAKLAANLLASRTQTLKDAILAELMPVVTRVLGYCAKEQPDDPISELVKGLREAAAKVDERSVDPYDDPIYAIQEAKVAAKKARDAERAEAAAAKREKEAQLKVLQFSAKLKNKNLSRTDPAAAHGAAAKKK